VQLNGSKQHGSIKIWQSRKGIPIIKSKSVLDDGSIPMVSVCFGFTVNHHQNASFEIFFL
jgi:hypothetical protein